MRINQVSSVKTSVYSRQNNGLNCRHCEKDSVPFKGNVSDKVADVVVKGSLLVGAGILYVASKIFTTGNKENKEGEGRDMYDENLDTWRMGDSTY